MSVATMSVSARQLCGALPAESSAVACGRATPALPPEVQQACQQALLLCLAYLTVMAATQKGGAGGMGCGAAGQPGEAARPQGAAAHGVPASGAGPGALPSQAPLQGPGRVDAAAGTHQGAAAGGVQAGAPSGVPGAPDTVPKRDDKPTDPGKTADDYLNANNGVLRKLGNQEGMKDKLKDCYGNWDDTSRSPQDRAQSAYNASRHLGIIKHKDNREGGDRGDVVGNGKMEGCTKDGDIRDGTEMADLKNSLKDAPPPEKAGDPRAWEQQDKNTNAVLGNPNLKDTKDPHVRLDGTNRNNDAVNLERAGKILSFINPLLGNVLKGAGEADREREVGAGEVLKGAAGGYLNFWKNTAVGAVDAIKHGRINPLGLAVSVYKEQVKDNVKDIVKDSKDRDF
jgi:hypothetical protein